MKSSASLLSPLLRSETQGRILAEIFLNCTREASIKDLAGRVGASPATVMREVDRLTEAGFASDRNVGRSRMVSANQRHPLYTPLRQMLSYSYGPVPILRGLLAGQGGVEAAYIFGSWAARVNGVPGHDPNDIDVMVVGPLRSRQLANLSYQATELCGRDVNIRACTPGEWAAGGGGLIGEIQTKPLVEVLLADMRLVA